MSAPSTDICTEEMASGYDERSAPLAPIGDWRRFLTRHVLEGRPKRSRVPSVGVGTGVDVLVLAKTFPDWSFSAVEPSLERES